MFFSVPVIFRSRQREWVEMHEIDDTFPWNCVSTVLSTENILQTFCNEAWLFCNHFSPFLANRWDHLYPIFQPSFHKSFRDRTYPAWINILLFFHGVFRYMCSLWLLVLQIFNKCSGNTKVWSLTKKAKIRIDFSHTPNESRNSILVSPSSYPPRVAEPKALCGYGVTIFCVLVLSESTACGSAWGNSLTLWAT
jgi:hypothetical protein